uniref:Uncharacterized protein n=1 Tax=Oryza nivara TaxID=4536 RepID=A0A0E0IEG4_ORYNI
MVICESERLGFLSVLPLLYAHNPSSNCHQQTSMQAAARQQFTSEGDYELRSSKPNGTASEKK